MSELYLIRHAQASFGSDNYDQLSPLGEKQAQHLGDYLRERSLKFDAVYTGSLTRQLQTLNLSTEYSKESHQVLTGLNEYNFVDLNLCYALQNPGDELVLQLNQKPVEKKTYFRLLRKVLIAWSKGDLIHAKESWPEFKNRVLAARLRIQNSGSERKVLAISSGGAINQFIATILDLSPEHTVELNLQMRNCSITRLYFNEKSISLSGFNMTPHLDQFNDPDLITYG
ncbi:MAG: broad specificity phosphatase PhoE [Gammaproteobacteria bacterium]|jgi:broad specificity phosphatase PhoE